MGKQALFPNSEWRKMRIIWLVEREYTVLMTWSESWRCEKKPYSRGWFPTSAPSVLTFQTPLNFLVKPSMMFAPTRFAATSLYSRCVHNIKTYMNSNISRGSCAWDQIDELECLVLLISLVITLFSQSPWPLWYVSTTSEQGLRYGTSPRQLSPRRQRKCSLAGRTLRKYGLVMWALILSLALLSSHALSAQPWGHDA